MEENMDELVALIVKKTGIPEATAKTVVTVVMNYLSKKLPAGIGTQVTALLSNEQAVDQAEELIGDVIGMIEKSSKTSKKK